MDTGRGDSFLKLIQRSQRGKHKIYLGYAPGVGKTYKMLLEAQTLQKDGIDVVIGVIETHGRSETASLLSGLELVPRRMFVNNGIEVSEMDIDAVLQRRPAVVLVDELAHTNAAGSRNSKRYQDVEELLSAGIHVISTLNIQHLESLYETVERETSVKVHERIPDHVVAEADQITNVDITAEDLRQRLQEGKIYGPESIAKALESFFTESNLEQLRELSLFELAAHIEAHQHGRREDAFSKNPNNIMVALSSNSPYSAALLRFTSRLAGRFNRSWYAVYVQLPKENPKVIDATTQRLLSNTLILAQQLGATVFTCQGNDIGETLLRFAREYRVGHIVMGTPNKRPSFWQRLRGKKSIMEQLVYDGAGSSIVIFDIRTLPSASVTDKMLLQNGSESSRRLSALDAVMLADENIIMWQVKIEKQEAMKKLFAAVCPSDIEEKEAAWDMLVQKYSQEAVYIGADVAIAHVQLTGVQEHALAVGICRPGVYDLESGQEFTVMLLLLSPLESTEYHLAILDELGRMGRNDRWRLNLLESHDPSSVKAAFQAWKDY